MPEEKEVAAEIIARAAETASKVTSDAANVAQVVIERATRIASTLAKETDERNTKSLVEALRQVFGENEGTGRFVDVAKIPLICQSIVTIHGDIKEIKEKLDERYVTWESFTPVKIIAFGLVGAVVLFALQQLLSTVFK